MNAPQQIFLETRLSSTEWLRSGLFAALLFAGLGTLTALWANPWFARMTPVSRWDFALLGAEAMLLGAYLGVRAPTCAVKQASLGGVVGFLGFGCALCNKLLVLSLGAGALLTYFEPVRTPLGWLGIGVLALALYTKLGRRLALPGNLIAGRAADGQTPPDRRLTNHFS
ncbi:MAG: hypothetical protein HY342_00230 [Candidatus Lambdaproteobacteria bacterium]|nr:hypothetical protein [Candidatus Lambdaproteobacteria bacterium]